jgi:peptide/nickel transport system permease protein
VLCIRVDDLVSAHATWDAEPVGAETVAGADADADAVVEPAPTAGVS